VSRAEDGGARIEVTEEDSGKTVARVLHDSLSSPHARIKGLILAGAVRCNGQRVTRVDARVRPGDRLEVRAEPGRAYRAPKRDRSAGPGFRIVHEDDHLVVVDKAAGVLSIPVPSLQGESLQDLLTARNRLRGHRSPEVRAVHRIDRYTSGLVAFSRTAAAWKALRRQFASGEPERVYLAVVTGCPAPPSGRLEHRLVEDTRSMKVRVAALASEGREATLRYRVTERFEDAALVEVRLETGRRNQIRVQFAAAGHPLVGDVAYGTPSERIPRVALHAWRLRLVHPVTGAVLRFEAEPHPDFRALLRRLRAAGGGAAARVTRPRGPGRRNR
jgi:23S rRNA pseudouridine1911/1915/1917 synthase